MALVDEAQLHLKAGKGGDGCVHFRHEKYIERGGPSGGDGGNGGSVFIESTSDITYLARYRGKTRYSAENAGDGGRMLCSGKNGEDITLIMPVGSVVTNLSTHASVEVLRPGERVCILHGGKGGRGNYQFRSATNRTPMEFEKGIIGEEADFSVELKLIIDIGFIGTPNAGKSSLLNELTAAKAKVAAYPFTTLEPNLGMLDGLVLADIPGLIEGASEGKGLGERFLRHVSRARALLHCISLDPHEEKTIKERHQLIRKEMGQYHKELLEKPEIIVLTKSDLPDDTSVAKALKEARKISKDALAVSIYDYESIASLVKAIKKFSEKKV